jgi:hypothetical protein
VFVELSALRVTQTAVAGNSASGGTGGDVGPIDFPQFGGKGGSSGGAGIFVAAGKISLVNGTFFGNAAKAGSGGGGFTFGFIGSPTRHGVGGDAAGGGLYLSRGSVSLTGITIASNQALAATVEPAPPGSSSGGGIANIGATSLVTNTTLIGDNEQDSGSASNGDDVSGPITSSFSLISQTMGAAITDNGGNLFNVNPGLDPGGLKFNGGPTKTVALESGSPAIDAVLAAHCTDLASPPHPLTTDQRGMPRPDFGELVCDIGAYESQETFAGQPGSENCQGVSVSTLAQHYGSINAAASALHFPNVAALQASIRAFCG